MFEIGAKVIRKADFAKAKMIIGTVSKTFPDRADVKWEVSHAGGSTANGHTSSLRCVALLELTDELMQDLRRRVLQRRAAEKEEWFKERPYLCNNVNLLARVSNDGHRAPMDLLPSQVKEGKCYYCGYPVQKKEAQ